MTGEPAPVGAFPRVALWGTFDLANFGDLLFPRIFVHELERRLPGVDIRVFSPLGHDHPVPMDGGFTAEPLGDWTRDRVRELARQLDLVAIGGGEIVHTGDELYARYYEMTPEEARRLGPSRFFIDGLAGSDEGAAVAWHAVGVPFDLAGDDAARVARGASAAAYVAVRDELSKSRLVAAGVDSEIAVVPDSGFLADRVLPRALLEKRLRYLRAMGWYPLDAAPVVVQGSVMLLDHAEEIGSTIRRALEDRPAPVVVVETGPCHGDGEFASALVPHLTGPVHRLPGDVAVEDVAAAIAHARAYVGLSMHGAIVAAVFGVPAAITNLVGYSKLDSLASRLGATRTLARTPAELRDVVDRVLAGDRPDTEVAELARAVDAHFDRLAELAERAAKRRSADPAATMRSALADADARYRRLLRAYEARGERLTLERLRFADFLERAERGDVRREAEARLLAHTKELGRLRSLLEAAAPTPADVERPPRARARARAAAARAARTVALVRYTRPARAISGVVRRRRAG